MNAILNTVIGRLLIVSEQMARQRHQLIEPPMRGSDQRAAERLDKWCHELEAIVEDIGKVDRSGEFTDGGRSKLTAMLALPANARENEIVSAVAMMLKRLQELEPRVVDADGTRADNETITATTLSESASKVVLDLVERCEHLERRIVALERRAAWK